MRMTKWNALKVGLALMVAVPLLSACAIYSQAEGNASLINADTAMFAINGNSSQLLENLFTSSNFCNWNITCFLDSAGGDVGGGSGPNPFWGDCEVTGPETCGNDWNAAMWGRAFTNPGGFPYSPEWETRCFDFEIPINYTAVIAWGLFGTNGNGAQSISGPEIPGSVNWVRVGNWSCAAT
jgi:hypothetical protein